MVDASVELAPDEVHCWHVPLDVPAGMLAGLDATLTPAERNRSARFRFDHDRRRFVAAHGILHQVLGRQLGVHPSDVRFVYNRFGKPALSREFGGRLKFNLSHSGDLALIAISAGADIGIDVEYIQRPAEFNFLDTARCFFPPDDIAHLQSVPSRLRHEVFFKCWTRQEAYVKARGAGLGDSPAERRGHWSFFALRPARGYIGALAVAGSGWRVRKWLWPWAFHQFLTGHAPAPDGDSVQTR